ncbi:MAG TPA: hypothetical protein VLK82_05440 [Candidatus Tectomicrobia bacterium]|nr:hypothetical protein [Candidatus Tectomicrobia bacterium]
MNALKRLQTIQATLGVAVGVVLSEQWPSWAKHWFPNAGVAEVLSLITVAVSVVVLKFMAGALFEKSKRVRRMLLGRQYIEGTWLDIMRADGKLKEIGVSWLRYDGSELRYTGEDYDLTLNHCSPYEAEMVQLKGQVLMYKYTARRSDNGSLGTQGYGELQFSPGRDGIPNKYSGSYFVLQGREKLSFEGFKLDEQKDSELLELLENGRTRKEALRRLLEEYAKDGKEQPVSPGRTRARGGPKPLLHDEIVSHMPWQEKTLLALPRHSGRTN